MQLIGENMRKTSFGIILVLAIAFLMSCGQSDKATDDPFTAREFVKDPAVVQCDSTLNAYVDASGDDYDFDGLKGIFEEYLERYPNSTSLHRSFQNIHFRYDKKNELVERYRVAFESDPNSAMYTYLYARSLDDDSVQIELFRKATELDPDYFWGWYGLAATLTYEPFGDTAAAIESYRNAILADNSQPSAFRFIGRLFKGRGDLDTALIYLNLLSQSEPDEISSLSPKVDILKKMERFEDAYAEITGFLDEHPEDYYAKVELVDLLDDRGMYAEAIPYLLDLTETADRPNDAYCRLMVMLCKVDQPDSALAALESAMSAGFDDYRTVLYDPDLEALRGLSGFAATRKSITDSMASMKAQREDERKDDRATRKKEALKEMLDQPAPDFSLVDKYGSTVALSELAGNVVMLDFWATWCGPCKLTMPLLQEFHDARGNEMKYYAVNVWQEDTTQVRPYINKYGYTFNILFGSSETATEYGVKGIPTMVVIGKQGKIRFQHIGYRPDIDEVLGWQLDELLKMN
jgi:thiol-disulfide isomerase/thioredoxin